MIDLHTHTLLSDGELLPSELVRRAEAKGYRAIALTDHVDSSNIDFVIPRLVKVCDVLNRSWKIRAIPGAEITHVPVEEISRLVKFARKRGARIVLIHGETPSEPVLPGTNRCGIEAGCDILAHPGNISEKDARLAAKKRVCLELTTRKSHLSANRHVLRTALKTGARLVLNNDAHSSNDLVSEGYARRFLRKLGLYPDDIRNILINSTEFARRKGGLKLNNYSRLDKA
jgi:histidinol phosphatase-like PHP family hydrolase